MNLIKRTICVLLILTMVISILPGTKLCADASSESEIQARIDDLYRIIKENGGYFNEHQSNECGKKESGHGYRCPHCKLENIVKSDWFVRAFGNVDVKNIPISNNGKVWSCYAFAQFAEWYIFRADENDKVTRKSEENAHGSFTYDFLSKNASVGDYLSIGDDKKGEHHGAVYLGCDSKKGVYVLDNNYEGTNNCMVSMHYIPWSYGTKVTVVYCYSVTTGRNPPARSYSLHMDYNGGFCQGVASESFDIAPGDSFSFDVRVPTRDNYRFVGWSRDPNATAAEYGSSDAYTPTQGETWYAVYKGVPYTIVYHANKSSFIHLFEKTEHVTVRYGDGSIISCDSFSKRNHHVVTWNTKRNGSGKTYFIGQSADDLNAKEGKPVHLYAQWGKGSSPAVPVIPSTPEQSDPPVAQKPKLSVSGESCPSVLQVGDNFGIRGTIKTDCGLITNVQGKILHSDGSLVQSSSKAPNEASHDLKNSINKDLKFGKLDPGEYIYQVIATAKNGDEETTEILIDVEFVVKEPESTPPPSPAPSDSFRSVFYLGSWEKYFFVNNGSDIYVVHAEFLSDGSAKIWSGYKDSEIMSFYSGRYSVLQDDNQGTVVLSLNLSSEDAGQSDCQTNLQIVNNDIFQTDSSSIRLSYASGDEIPMLGKDEHVFDRKRAGPKKPGDSSSSSPSEDPSSEFNYQDAQVWISQFINYYRETPEPDILEVHNISPDGSGSFSVSWYGLGAFNRLPLQFVSAKDATFEYTDEMGHYVSGTLKFDKIWASLFVTIHLEANTFNSIDIEEETFYWGALGYEEDNIEYWASQGDGFGFNQSN